MKQCHNFLVNFNNEVKNYNDPLPWYKKVKIVTAMEQLPIYLSLSLSYFFIKTTEQVYPLIFK